MRAIKRLCCLLLMMLCSIALRVQERENMNTFTDYSVLKKYQDLITPSLLATHLYYLASDEMQGRETGQPGQKLAAKYLASQYRLAGLTGKGTTEMNNGVSDSSFFQPFNLYPVTPNKVSMDVLVKGRQAATADFSANYSSDLFYFDGGNARSVSASVVFAGYGIAADSLGYNDFTALKEKNISVDDKWVMLLDDEPLADEKTSLLPTYNHQRSPWAGGFFHKRLALWHAGKPKGILIVTDLVPGHKDSFDNDAAAAAQNAVRTRLLSSFDTTAQVQAYCISSKMANIILQGKAHSIEALQKQIDTSLQPVVFDVSGVIVSTKIEKSKPLATENVLAFIEGSDPSLKHEVVIVSSHYDHLGINTFLKGDQIYNGAADNASGTVACLAMARAFMQAKQQGMGPKRSVLFINFSGEEKGLLGSMYYINNKPVISLDNTVALINMDGIGGIDRNNLAKSTNYVYIEHQKGLSDELLAITTEMNDTLKQNTAIIDANNMGFTSDDQPFRNEYIPFLYFSTGRTEFYHQPADEASTIDYDQMAVNVKLVFATAWQVANQNKRISSPRNYLKKNGYICHPCGLPCDQLQFNQSGICPVCGMWLVQGYNKDQL